MGLKDTIKKFFGGKEEQVDLSMSVKVETRDRTEAEEPPKPTGNNAEIKKLMLEIEALSHLITKPLEEIYNNADLPNPDIPYEDIVKGDSHGVLNNLGVIKNSLKGLELPLKEFCDNDIETFYAEWEESIESNIGIIESSFYQINKWLGNEKNDPKYDYK